MRGILLFFLITVTFLLNTSEATLIDRGGGLIYDDDLNITWLQDANYAMTSGYDDDGRMNWYQSMDWAANLSYFDSIREVTYNDWRLPTVDPAVEGFYKIDTELGHLFHIELGNYSQLVNTGPFINFQESAYWSSSSVLDFYMGQNYLLAFTLITSGPNGGEIDTTDASYFQRYSLLVRDGDVAAAPIPEPSTFLLLGGGLAGLAFYAHRRRKE